ncbi:tetratricopeptide repeat protein, partial [Caldisericum sp.]|uniref:tetratricopeptide repeat protein n=1 Tax=Caldisericum sp. TaxID=2499687 RepID=UPI003D138197
MKQKLVLAIFLMLALIGIAYAQMEIERCVKYLNAGDYQRAIEAGKRAVKLYPRSVDAYFCLGIAYTKTGQIDLAIESLKKAEAYAIRDDDLMYIYNWLGYNYYAKGDLDNSLFYNSKSLD